ncbi:hypothetical protein BOTBODRAFT_115319 [Botryobasidium botryosum FD-172 SS1]|uniref:Uncharacterized protein n=1 Tax=Botryobasidium botryosum (strain FD-172 SS1) TaxID=930990 RepID=A0A067MGP9_BOTB1|nr:hypothetical protein BOTBODRAFT_115319 [Botryobasidium botryosum FD-172 SS1]
MVNILLQGGADVNLQLGGYGDTALHFASRDGRVSTVRVLLASGADPNIRDSSGQTALRRALGNDDRRTEVVSSLLKAGADVDVEDTEAVSLLLQGAAILNVADDTGATLLHYTSRRSSPSVNRLLLDLGADPRICDNSGHTPLFDLIYRGDAPLLHAISKYSVSHTSLLLKLGTSLHSELAPGPASLRFWAAMTEQGEMDIVLALVLRLGIDINESGRKTDQSVRRSTLHSLIDHL